MNFLELIEQEIEDQFRSAVRVETQTHAPLGLNVYFECRQAVPVGLGFVPVWKHTAAISVEGNVITISFRMSNRIKVDITHPDSISTMLDALKKERPWPLIL